MDSELNALLANSGTSLMTDPPLHDQIRKITSAPMLPRALQQIGGCIDEAAITLVDGLLQRKAFDGMRDLAQVLPLTIVAELVGLPEYGKASMLRWANATFNVMGPMNELGRHAKSQIVEYHEFCRTQAIPRQLRRDGWAARLYQAADRGEISIDLCPGMVREYIGPSLDTTIFAIGHLIYLLGSNPRQWQLLKRDRSLVPSAINEALRMESPIRSFTRLVTQDVTVGDMRLRKGDRVIVLYASANRDPSQWERPDDFDITRPAGGHLAFGFGVHSCAGMHLAKLEIGALLSAMLDKIDRFEVGRPVIALNNTLRGYSELPVLLN